MEEKEILMLMEDENCKYDYETAKKRLIFWLDELKMYMRGMYEEEKPFLKTCKDNIDYFYYVVRKEVLKRKLERGE